MYTQQLTQNLSAAVDLLKNEQRFKSERELQGGQGPVVKLKNHEVIMLAANNYLGLANHPVIKKAAQDIVEKYGFGMSSVRFICGTQDLHRRLEKRLAKFLGTEDAMLFSSCFAATDGVFSMEGDLAPLPELIKLAQEHQALLFVDDSHGVGAIGPNGKGAAEELNVLGQIV